ncbi:MAG: hypothetical protein WBO06_06710, partial [Gammaproteobacteria bacterium]
WNPGTQDADMAGQNMPGNAASDDRFDLDIYFILVRFLLHADKLQTSNIKIRALLENDNAFSTDTL